jgi:hypothetical protein
VTLVNFSFTYSISPGVLVMTTLAGLCSTARENSCNRSSLRFCALMSQLMPSMRTAALGIALEPGPGAQVTNGGVGPENAEIGVDVVVPVRARCSSSRQRTRSSGCRSESQIELGSSEARGQAVERVQGFVPEQPVCGDVPVPDTNAASLRRQRETRRLFSSSARALRRSAISQTSWLAVCWSAADRSDGRRRSRAVPCACGPGEQFLAVDGFDDEVDRAVSKAGQTLAEIADAADEEHGNVTQRVIGL